MTVVTYTLPQLASRVQELDGEIAFLREFTKMGGEYAHQVPTQKMRNELYNLLAAREVEKRCLTAARDAYLNSAVINVDLSVDPAYPPALEADAIEVDPVEEMGEDA